MPKVGDIAQTADIPTGKGIAVYSSMEQAGDILLQITTDDEPIAQVVMPRKRLEEMCRAVLSGGTVIQ